MKKLFTLSALLLSANSFATDVYSEQFQAVKSIELVEVISNENGEEEEKLIGKQDAPDFLSLFTKSQGVQKSTIAGVIMTTKQLIALGKEIYKIVEAGKPVLTTSSKPIQVLPKTARGEMIQPLDLEGWKSPVTRKLRLKVKNYLGMTPAVMEFMLIFAYGGSYEGKGSYITGAQIKATHVELSWGYKLDAAFKVQSIMNAGSSANPVAAAMISIDYKLWTVLKEMKDSRSFYINGRGKIKAY